MSKIKTHNLIKFHVRIQPEGCLSRAYWCNIDLIEVIVKSESTDGALLKIKDVGLIIVNENPHDIIRMIELLESSAAS